MIGDSFCGWIDTFRTHAAEDRIKGRKAEFKRRSRGWRPSALTISSWYFSVRGLDKLIDVEDHRRLTITGKIAQCKRSLALDLETWTIHECNHALYELRLRAGETFAVLTVNSDVAQCGSAVVLDVGIWGLEEGDHDGYRASGHKLLSVVI